MRNKQWIHFTAAAVSALTIFVSSVPVSAGGQTAPVDMALPGAGAELYFSPRSVSLEDVRQEYAPTTESVNAGAAQATRFEGGWQITMAANLSAATSTSMGELRSAADRRDEEAPRQVAQPQETAVTTQSQTQSLPVTVDLTISGASAMLPIPIQTAPGAQQQAEPQGADDSQASEVQGDLPTSGVVIAHVDDFINVREAPDTEAPIIGKFHGGAVGEILGETNGWFMIESGTVTGFVKAEFCVTGEEANDILPQIAVRYATVNTMSLNLREEDNTTSDVLEILEIGDKFVVLEEYDEWVRIEAYEGEEGYLFKEYVNLTTEYRRAESREEEEARLEREREREEERLAQIAAASQSNAGVTGVTQQYTPAANYATTYSDTGAAVAAFALQFVGNPYVWGGSSLTNGTDCSGFTMAVYANFGISLPHGTYWQMDHGTPVESLEVAAPGDVVIYRGHAGIYIGNGQIVHASHPGVGIIVSSAYYDTPIGIRRFFL